MKNLKAVIAGMALGCVTQFLYADQEPHLNIGRFGMPAVTIQDKIYVLGGWANTGAKGDIEIISSSGSVEELEEVFSPRYWHAAESYNGKIYIIGGYAASGASDFLAVYDPVAKSSKKLAPWPCPRVRAASVVYNAKIYVIGGEDEFQERTGDVDIYDIKRNRWTRGAPMPTARECDAVLKDGKIYAIAGYNGTTALKAFEEYNPRKNKWEKLPDLPFKMSAHHAVVCGAQLYTFGDYEKMDRVAAYDFNKKTWCLVDVDFKPSRHNAVVECGKRIFIIGGNIATDASYLDSVQIFDEETLAQAPRRPYNPSLDDRPSLMPPMIDPQVLRLFSEITNRQAQIQSLKLSGSWHMKWTAEKTEPTHIDFVYSRPDRLFFSNETLCIAADGKNVTELFAASKKYLQIDAKKTLDQALASGGNLFAATLFPDLKLLTSDNPGKIFEKIAAMAELKILPDEKIDENVCWVLSAKPTTVLHLPLPTLTVWIDQQFGLIRKIESIPSTASETKVSEEATAAALMNKMSFSYSLDQIIVNEPVDEKDFALTPPADYVKVDTIQELYGLQNSGDRFALSGKPAPDFELKLVTGKTAKLSDYKGKVVLLDFWATWCGPCVRSLPHMSELGKQYKNSDVVILGISRDGVDQEEKVKRFLDKYEITYPVGIDTEEIATNYKVSGIPCLVLIGKDGTIQGRKVGFNEGAGEELKKSIETLRAGKTLPGGKPMTDEEKAEEEKRAAARQPRSMSTSLDETNFVVRWKSTEHIESRYSGNTRILVRIPQRYFTARTQTNLVVVDARTGQTVLSAPSAPQLQPDDMHRESYCGYLPTTNGGLVVSAQNHYEKHTENGETYYRSTGGAVTAFDAAGIKQWELTVSEQNSITSLDTIPDPDRPNALLLLLGSWNGIMIVDATGQIRLNQKIAYSDRIEIADLDNNGKPEIYIIGPQTGSYEIHVPPTSN